MKVCTSCGAKWRGEPSVCPLDGGALEEIPDPLLGRTIGGRYVILERIGAGGMGVVYRASHEAAGVDVAVKFLAPELAADHTNRERFLREARAANRIDHEHIIDITDFGETDDGMVYLVMEYLAGETLAEVIYQSPLSVPRAIDIAVQMATALARAHELDVIHRDIKPENVFLLPRAGGGDFVKLLDFGLAKMKGEIRLTATGAVFGTPEYMAPEQARGMPLTGKADLYALGCLIYEMLTGDPPFDGPAPELILKHIRATPEPPSTRMPNIPKPVDDLVLRLLEKDPAHRHRDAHHLLEALTQVSAQLPRPIVLPTLKDMRFDDTLLRAVRRAPSDAVSAAVETWSERLVQFRALAAEVHGSNPPGWLTTAMDELAGGLEELARRREDLSRSATLAMSQEGDARDARLQMGVAIDELGRDESRTARTLELLDDSLAEAQAIRDDVERELREAWSKALAPGADEPVAPASLEALEAAARHAAEWREHVASVEQLDRERARVETERDDLRFQITQLKGRLGTLSAETDFDLDTVRMRVRRVDQEMHVLHDRVASRSEAIVKHLLTFPQLVERVREAQRA